MLDRAYLAEGVPTMIVWGRHDAIIPVGHGRLAHAAIAGSELEIFDDAGHFPHHADPARFADLVADFVARTDTGRLRPRGLAGPVAARRARCAPVPAPDPGPAPQGRPLEASGHAHR